MSMIYIIIFLCVHLSIYLNTSPQHSNAQPATPPLSTFPLLLFLLVSYILKSSVTTNFLTKFHLQNLIKPIMKFYQSSSSEAQLSEFKPARNCLPCFQSHSTNHHTIKKDMTEPLYVKTNPGVVAKLMGLDSIPQRRIPLVHHQEDTRGHPNGKTSMVLEIKKGKFFVLGFEAGCRE
ncbi:hypothetical protein Hanom_Chr16g01482651 [Helianthus anomalus]